MHTGISRIRAEDFNYILPEDKIAQQPSDIRDDSKLLMLKNGGISEDRFYNLDKYLPSGTTLVFNDTKVIRARILFRKETGSRIEIFCLEPVLPTREITSSFQATSGVVWIVLIGNLKRWKSGKLILDGDYQGQRFTFSAQLISLLADGTAQVRFEWNPPDITFVSVLELVGRIPLPPYIHRDPVDDDAERYQTVFAQNEGSVAAPTAGLHFTKGLLNRLEENKINRLNITLHVGAGTFRHVTSENIAGHVMHEEKISVSAETIKALLNIDQRPVIAVGTTAARTLESLYWAGLSVIRNGGKLTHHIPQWIAYEPIVSPEITTKEALGGLLEALENKCLTNYDAETRLMIVPGYNFRILSGLITNFHVPKSTLLMLVAAMIGERWKEVYHYAATNGFRFLSYGDSCLFFNQE